MKNTQIELGKEYNFAGYRWVPVHINKENQVAVMQSLGVTAGPWPGFSMEKYGNGKIYKHDIFGEDISEYNKDTKKLMDQIRPVAVNTVIGRGLYLASYLASLKYIDSVKDIRNNSVWEDAIIKAAANYRSFGTSGGYAWIGTYYGNYGNYGAWIVDLDGKTTGGYQGVPCVVPAAFNLDLSKIEIEGDEIVIKNMNEKETKLSVKDFDRDWNQGTIRNLVKNHCYLEFGQHADLKALCINEEDILPDGRDWMELTFVVPTEWLKDFCRNEFGVKDLDYFLQEEYTTDESEIVFSAALNERQVVMVDFV